MASNFFGNIFKITTFGESHGPCIGVVIDGCPSGIEITESEIFEVLKKRRPGSLYTSPRKELDIPKILSGVFNGITTGAPIAIIIENQDQDSKSYEEIKNIFRPGHANYTYLEKYGIFDYRGGGRASARETVARVAAGAVANKFLAHFGVDIFAFVSHMGSVSCPSLDFTAFKTLKTQSLSSPVFCPFKESEEKMIQYLQSLQKCGDSTGAIVSCIAKIPKGLGEPIYGKLEALLASAMLSIPASKGFEIGDGFSSSTMKGSEHNDAFCLDTNNNVSTLTNHAGGVLGGISNGQLLYFKVAFKPTSSIKIPQKTVDFDMQETLFQIPENGRHDACVGLRAVPVVEAMTSLVLADLLLHSRHSRLS